MAAAAVLNSVQIYQAPTKFARSRPTVAPVVNAEVHVLGLAVSETTPNVGAVGEELTEDLAVPRAQQFGDISIAPDFATGPSFEQLGQPVDADAHVSSGVCRAAQKNGDSLSSRNPRNGRGVGVITRDCRARYGGLGECGARTGRGEAGGRRSQLIPLPATC